MTEEQKTARQLVKLYNSYSNALINEEKTRGRQYSDEDFNSLEGFMNFLSNNINNL